MSIRVIKAGGRPLADEGWLSVFGEKVAESVAEGGTRTVVVHGGGPEVDELSNQLGVPVERIDGVRVTTEESLTVATMILSGVLNKRIVSMLIDSGLIAVGLSGEDGRLLEAVPLTDVELGRVGRVARVQVPFLERLLDDGVVPVISPISRGPAGPLNVNADEAAHAVAVALGAEELVYLTDVPAVRGSNGPLSDLTVDEATELVENGVAHDGMVVKLTAASDALRSGVSTVRIGNLEMLSDADAGTRLRAMKETVV